MTLAPSGWKKRRAEVNLHEAFWTDDQCLIVMDLAHGGNLFDTLHKDIVNSRSDPFRGLGHSASSAEKLWSTKYGKVILFLSVVQCICSNLFNVFAHFVTAFAGGKEFASKYVAGQLLLGLDRAIYA